MFKTLQKAVTASGTPEKVSAAAGVGSGIEVTVKALNANTGTMYVGSSSADALKTSGINFPLAAGEWVSMIVQDLNEIWVDSSVSGEKVAVIYEPRLS